MNEVVGLFVLSLLALGAVVVLVLPRVAPTRMEAGPLWRLYGAQLVIVGFILGPAYLGGWAHLAALVVLVVRAQWEFLRLTKPGGTWSHATLVLGVVGLLAAGWLDSTSGWSAFLLAPLAGLALIPRSATRPFALEAASLVIPATLVASLALLGQFENGFAWIAFVYVVVEVNDTAAYLLGKAFGRRRILPRLSPSKTGAGLAGGIASALLAGLAVAVLALDLPWAIALGAVLAALLGGIAGDLATSWIKRRWEAKDFPALHPALGGALDIYDSLLFAAPPVCLYHRLVVA